MSQNIATARWIETKFIQGGKPRPRPYGRWLCPLMWAMEGQYDRS